MTNNNKRIIMAMANDKTVVMNGINGIPINNSNSLNQQNQQFEKVRVCKYKIDVLEPRNYYESKTNKYLLEKVVDNIEELIPFIGLCYNARTCKRESIVATCTILKEYYKRMKLNKPITYSPCKSSPYGRHFSKEKSLQGLCRVIRHLICYENYTDIDIKNCHPTLLSQLCKVYNIECKHLDYYINNRDKCVLELINISGKTKDECKTMMLSLLNGKQEFFDNMVIPDWVQNYYDEMCEIHTYLSNHDDVKVLKKQVLKEPNQYNITGKIINKLLCKYENICIQHAIHYCDMNTIVVDSPQFDGMLCQNNEKLDSNFLKKMSEYVFNETGLLVEFAYKEMTEHIPLLEKLNNMRTISEKLKDEKNIKKKTIEQQKLLEKQRKEIEKLQKEQEKKDSKVSLPECSEETYATLFLESFLDCLMYSKKLDKLYRYNSDNRLWEKISYDKLTTSLTSILEPYINRLIEKTDNETILSRYDKEKASIYSTRKKKDIVYQIKQMLPDSSERVDSLLDNSTILFPFKNKVVNLETLETRDRVKEDYFTKTTSNNYIDNLSDTDRKKVYDYIEEIIYPPNFKDNGEYRDSFLTLLSHYLTNDNSIKKISVFIGTSNSGKSANLALNKKVLDSFQTTAPRRLVVQSRSESVLTTELSPLIGGIRMTCISELDEGEKFNESLLKQISGDDKEFQVRLSSDTNYEKAFISTKLNIATNTVPNYTDPAFQRRLLYINFPNFFKEDSSKKDYILSLSNILFTILCEKAHELIKNNFEFIPHELMVKETTRINEEKDSLKSFIDDNLFFTDNIKDRVLKSSLYPDYIHYCKNNDLISLKKITFDKMIKDSKYKLTNTIKSNGYDFFTYVRMKSIYDSYKETNEETKEETIEETKGETTEETTEETKDDEYYFYDDEGTESKTVLKKSV